MKYKVIDLFAGCGGLSTGYEMNNFEVLAALEKDEWASKTYKRNHPNTNVITCDITDIEDPLSLFQDAIEVDGIIGGPPCQGFSLSGKRDKKDPRNSLFMDFIRFVKAYQPKFFMMENVPGILSMQTQKGEKVIDLIFQEYKRAGYNAKYFLLNAANYGVPQSRHRVIFIGVRSDLEYDLELLKPITTHEGTNQVTIDEAILDLPQIESGEGEEVQNYRCDPQNKYQKAIRNGSKVVYNHIAMRHTQRLISRFATIQCGQSLADVSEEHMQRKRGNADVTSGKVYAQNNMRPFGDRPSPTIAASFQSNFIHPHLNRNYTAREAARLQSFPDTYIFEGKRTTMSWEKNLSQYQQIGNAVPPLLAKAVSSRIQLFLDSLNKWIYFARCFNEKNTN